MAETRLSVHVYDKQYQTVQFLSYAYKYQLHAKTWVNVNLVF